MPDAMPDVTVMPSGITLRANYQMGFRGDFHDSSPLGWAPGGRRLSPVSEDPVLRHRGCVLFRGFDQLTRAQFFDRNLSRAFRETCGFRDHAKAGCNRSPLLPLSLAVKI